MSPTAKTPGSARLEFLGVDLERPLLERQAPLGDRPELRMQPEEHQQLIGRQVPAMPPSGFLMLTPRSAPSSTMQRMRQRLEAAHAPGGDQLPHLGHRGGRGAELAAAVHEVDARGARQQLERPVERRVAAAEDHQALAGKLGRVLDAVLDAPCPRTPRRPRRRCAAAGTSRRRRRSRPRRHRSVMPPAVRTWKRPSSRRGELHHLLAEVELRLEGLDLLQQPVDQLLRAAHRQRRNVVDRLVRIELRALAAGVRAANRRRGR